MNIDEINAQIAKIDRRLASENKYLADRIDIVVLELCPDINNLGDRFLNRFYSLSEEELDRFFSTLQVDNWYRKNYGYKQIPDYFIIKETPFFLQGQIWYFTHPEKIEHYNINCTNLSELVKQNLTEEENEYLINLFKCSRQKLEAIKYLNDVAFYRNEERKTDPDVPFIVPDELKNNFYLHDETIKLISFAIEDLNIAIVTLKNTSDYQFVIFPASQAIEKLLKACLIEEELKHKYDYEKIQSKKNDYEKIRSKKIRNELRKEYGHHLFYILQKLECYLEISSKIVDEVKKIPYAEEMFRKLTKEERQEITIILGELVTINPRYDVIKISSEQAVKVIDATLNIFELVSKKLTTPLERARHYPELEEGYNEYYDQLEDDDSF